MNLQLPSWIIDDISKRYAESCILSPKLMSKFTDWKRDQSEGRLETLEEFLDEVRSRNEDTFEDVLDVNVAKADLAYNSGNYAEAVNQLEEAVVTCLRGIRWIKTIHQAQVEHKPGTDASCETPSQAVVDGDAQPERK